MAANGRPQKNARQEAAALGLARGLTVRKAAAKAAVGERTLARWLTLPAFRRRVSELRSRMVERASGRLANGMTAAAVVLYRLLKSGSERVRLAAAKALLEVGPRSLETADLAERLTEVERLLRLNETPRLAG